MKIFQKWHFFNLQQENKIFNKIKLILEKAYKSEICSQRNNQIKYFLKWQNPYFRCQDDGIWLKLAFLKSKARDFCSLTYFPSSGTLKTPKLHCLIGKWHYYQNTFVTPCPIFLERHRLAPQYASHHLFKGQLYYVQYIIQCNYVMIVCFLCNIYWQK